MSNIIPYDDKPLVDEKALAKQHFDLVEKLKESLYVGQAGFIKAGQFLSEIKASETYKAEDSQQDISWQDFVSRPDLPLSGVSVEGRMRVAQKLMTVWDTIAKNKNIDEKLLAEIGYTKLALVAGVINKDPKADVNTWLAKAKELTTVDLQAEVSDGGQSLADLNACKHLNVEKIDAWKCTDCKKFLKENPNAK